MATQFNSKPVPSNCENPLCPVRARSWFGLKKPPRGVWLNDHWYCSTTCLGQGAERLFRRIDLLSAHRRPLRYRQPIGLLMHSRGLITSAQLKAALLAQKEAGAGRLGEWLVRIGATTEEQVTATLSLQWGCPVIPLDQKTHFLEWKLLVPVPLLKAARVIVAHGQPSSRIYYLAFADGVDHTLIRAFETMYECDAKPCVARESTFNDALAQLEAAGQPPTTMADCEYHPVPMSQTLQEAVEAKDSESVRLVSCSGFCWIRLQHGGDYHHLLFSLPESEKPAEELLLDESLVE